MDKSMEKKKAFIDWFEKSKKGYDVGTIKEFGGKKYIKTNNGWKYYSNKSQSQKKETKEDKKDTPTVEYLQQVKKWAEKASITALKDAIQSKNVEDSVKEIAKEEILKRKQKLKETEAQVKKEETASKQVKKITQTYVKVNGDQIIIKMKNENQYKATKGSFKLESEVGEDLASFKKKVIESYKNKDKIEQKDKIVEQPSKKTTLHFDNEGERTDYLIKSNDLDELTKEQQNELSKYKEDYREEYKKRFQDDSVLLDQYDQVERRIVNFLNKNDFNSLLKMYANVATEDRKFMNFTLMENGFQPIVNGSIYSTYNNRTYEDLSTSVSAYEIYEKMKQFDFTDEEFKSLKKYTGPKYPSFRRCLEKVPYEGEKEEYEPHIKNIANMIDKNRIKEDIVLTRRMAYKSLNSLNKWLDLREGDVITDNSFVSFSLKHKSFFGNDFSITLLAKKNDPIMNAHNAGELEFLVQKGTKFKVLKKGLNSIVVEIV